MGHVINIIFSLMKKLDYSWKKLGRAASDFRGYSGVKTTYKINMKIFVVGCGLMGFGDINYLC